MRCEYARVGATSMDFLRGTSTCGTRKSDSSPFAGNDAPVDSLAPPIRIFDRSHPHVRRCGVTHTPCAQQLLRLEAVVSDLAADVFVKCAYFLSTKNDQPVF